LLNTILGSFSSGVVAVPSSYESIATVTVGSGGSANVEFTSIPSTYTHLQLRWIARGADASNNRNCNINFNSDTGSNYAFHTLAGDGSSASSSATTTTTGFLGQRMPAASATASIFGAAVIDILDYTNTNKYKTARIVSSFDDNGGTFGGIVRFISGLWMNTNAITSIKLQMNVGNIAQYSQFALYGIKGA
jgi:hypothetical protein